MKLALPPTLPALALSLVACSQPAPEPAPVEQAVAAASPRPEPRSEKPLTLTDAEGNELDPEVAEAVQEAVAAREMELREAGESEDGDWGEGS